MSAHVHTRISARVWTRMFSHVHTRMSAPRTPAAACAPQNSRMRAEHLRVNASGVKKEEEKTGVRRLFF